MVWIVFFALARACAYVWHRWATRFWVATWGAALSTGVSFQVLAWLQAGYLDALALVGFVVSVGGAVVLAAAVWRLVGAMVLAV